MGQFPSNPASVFSPAELGKKPGSKRDDVRGRHVVYLGPALVGVLEQNDVGKMRFRYGAPWLAGRNPVGLSHSLPLRVAIFNDCETRPFFAGLLPDADKRALVAKALGVSRRNDFALLARVCGECAGAVTLLPVGESPLEAASAADYRPLDEKGLARVFALLPERPLLAGEEGVRLSLAGAQEKLPVLARGRALALPLHGSPSSHIVKPRLRRRAGTVPNEAFCLRLARDAGLPTVSAAIRRAGNLEYLLVERYDRRRDEAGGVQRVHQEDFCQALGIPPELEYESEGGPSLKDCFALVRGVTARPVVELARLLDAVIVNVLVGNNDAHGKNFSLLYGDAGPTLAPLYDLTSTAVYPSLAANFAMRIGDARTFAALGPRDWARLAKDAGLGPAQVRNRVLELAGALRDAAPRVRAAFARTGHADAVLGKICETVVSRATKTVRDLKVGRS